MRARLEAGRVVAPFLRRCGWLVALALLITAASPAHGAPSTKFYGTDHSGYAIRGEDAPVTLKLINRPTSTQTLGSANFAIPTAHGLGVAVPGLDQTISVTTSNLAKVWTVRQVLLSGQRVLEFRANSVKNALAPGEYLEAPISVSASCSATAGTFTSSAKQSNDFSGVRNDVTPQGLNETVAVKRLARSIAFTGQPTSELINQTITPDVVVTAYTICPGDVATDASGTVALDILNDSSEGSGALQGTTSKPISTGTASFSDLSVNESGSTYTMGATFNDDLTVSSPDLTALRSQPFDIYNKLCLAGSEMPCEHNTPSTKVVVPAPPLLGSMALSLSGDAKPFDCGLASPVTSVGALATIVPDGYTTDTIDVTLTYAKAVLTVALSQTTTCLSHDGGVSYDPVPNCRRPEIVPCIASRGGTQGGDGVVVLRIDPEDPIGGTYS
jgi:hypothetical protein